MASLRKGQVSIEFILIVAIALVYINAVVWPSVENSSQTALDIKAVADAKVSSMRLAEALDNAASSSGDMRTTVSIFLPENAEIECKKADARIDYSVLVGYMNGFNPMKKDGDVGCEAVPNPDNATETLFECASNVKILQSAASALDSCPAMKGPLFRKLVVEKKGATIFVEWSR